MEDPSFPLGMCSPPTRKDQAKQWGPGTGIQESVWSRAHPRMVRLLPEPSAGPECDFLGPGRVVWGPRWPQIPQNPAAPLQVPESAPWA